MYLVFGRQVYLYVDIFTDNINIGSLEILFDALLIWREDEILNILELQVLQ